jgi:hypothetical protein
MRISADTAVQSVDEIPEVTITDLLDQLRVSLFDNAERFTDLETQAIVRAALQNDREEFAVQFTRLHIENGVSGMDVWK